jgi:hypothetical protein
MPTNLTPLSSAGQMTETTLKYFQTVRLVLELTISEAKTKEKHVQIAEAIPVLRELINTLYENVFSAEFSETLYKVYSRMNVEDTFIASLLTQEMVYYNTLYDQRQYVSEQKAFDVKDGLEDAKTIKDSFEKLIRKLPGLVKKGLSILNEILGLAKSIV